MWGSSRPMSPAPRRTIWIRKGNDPPTAPKSSCRAVPNASPVKTQGEQERRERPEERADRSFCARQTEENHENTDERPLSNGRSDKPTARLPRARGALKDQVISRHGNTVRSRTEPGNVQISIQPFSVRP